MPQRRNKYIVFVSQEEVFVRVYSRTEQPAQWLDADYRSLDDTVRLGDLALPLRSVYRKTPLAAWTGILLIEMIGVILLEVNLTVAKSR